MATIQDIANEVGISKAAVSRILNHKGSFSQETIRRVQETARRLNYSGISVYHQEEEERMKIIAVIFPTYELPAFGYHISMLESAAYDFGYNLLLCGSLFDKEKKNAVFDYLRQKKVSGVLLGSPVGDSEMVEHIDLPFVTIGYKLSDHIPAVRSDDYTAGRLAARHLIGKGCRKPIYLCSYMGDPSTDLRRKGFFDEYKQYGVEELAYHADLDMQISHDFNGLISSMLLDHSDIDSVFAETDVLGLSCIQTCMSLGYQIPQDIRIITYSIPFYSRYSYPRMTIIRDNTELLVRKAVALLSKRIEDAEAAVEGETVIPVSLQEGMTT